MWPAHVVVTVFVLVDVGFPRLAFAFLLDVGQAVAEAVFVLVDQLVVVDVQVVCEVATVCVTVTVVLSVTVTVVVLAGLVTVDVVVVVTIAGGVVLALGVVDAELTGVVDAELTELVLDGRFEAPQAPEGSIALSSSVTAAVSA